MGQRSRARETTLQHRCNSHDLSMRNCEVLEPNKVKNTDACRQDSSKQAMIRATSLFVHLPNLKSMIPLTTIPECAALGGSENKAFPSPHSLSKVELQHPSKTQPQAARRNHHLDATRENQTKTGARARTRSGPQGKERSSREGNQGNLALEEFLGILFLNPSLPFDLPPPAGNHPQGPRGFFLPRVSFHLSRSQPFVSLIAVPLECGL